MAKSSKSTSRSIHLDTTSAQSAVDNLQKKVQKLDKALEDTSLSQKKRDELSKQRADAEAKRLQVLEQINKGLGATYNQQSRYIRDLQRDIKNIAVGTEEWQRKAMELRKANAVFEEMKQKMNGVQQAQDKAGGGFSKMAKGLVAIGAAAVSITAVTGFLKDSIKEAQEAETRLSRLKMVLSNLGREDVFDRLTASAERLADQFRHLDNDDVLGVFDQLITYGKVTEAQMNQLLPVIIDFAAKTGMSLEESASVMIKSLEGNNKSLREFGINMKEGETVAERFGILMEELVPKVEGAGKAFGETLAGKTAIANQELDNMKELVGGQLTPIWTGLLNVVSKVMLAITTAFSIQKQAFNFIKGSITSGGSFFKNTFTKGPRAAIAEFKRDAQGLVDDLKKGQQDVLGNIFGKTPKAAGALDASKDKTFDTGGGGLTKEQRAAAAREAERKKRELEQAQKELAKLLDEVSDDIDKGTLSETALKFKQIDDEFAQRIQNAKALAIKTGMSKGELKAVLDKILEARDAVLTDLFKSKTPAVPIPVRLDASKAKEISPADKKALEDYLANATGQLSTSTRQNKIQALELQILKSSGRARLEAQRAQLELEMHQEIETKKATGAQKAIIEEQYRQKGVALEQSYRDQQVARVQEYLSYASQAMNIINTLSEARNARENAQFEKERKQNDSRKKQIQALVDKKVITETEGKKRLGQLEAEEAKRKEALDKKQFERNKRMQIAQAIINGAMAVTSTLAARPGAVDIISLGAFRAINIAIAVASTAAQVATIASQKFAKGGKVLPNGKINTPQNIPTQSNGDNVLATVKTGEVILNEDQQRRLGGARTFAALGVPGFAGGGRVLPGYLTRPYQAINYPAIQRSYLPGYADGGLVQRQTDSGITASGGDAATRQQVVVQSDPEMKQLMRAVLYRLDQPLEVPLYKIQKAELLQQQMRDDAQFRP